MARTIAEIKQEMTDAFMASADVRERYGLTSSDTFDAAFSKVSIESLLFYTVAAAMWVLEKIFDTHRADVDAALEARQPCTARWYRDQILALRDLQGNPYATACSVRGEGSGILVKVQQGPLGDRRQCTEQQLQGINAWLSLNHEAGVPYSYRSAPPDILDGAVTVYYDPRAIDTPADTVRETLSALLSDVPYDGVISVNDMTMALLAVEGIRRVQLQGLTTARYNGPAVPLNVQTTAYSGSWRLSDNFSINCLPYTTATI